MRGAVRIESGTSRNLFGGFIGARRVGAGGLGHGDNRTFAGNDPSQTARVMVLAIVSTDATSYSAAITEKRVAPSLIGGGPTDAWTVAKTGVTESPPQSLQGSADASITTSNNQMRQGESDFGKGIDVTVAIANGTNGGQQLGRDMQATGAVMAGTGSPGAGTVVAGAGKVVEAASPAGTIDGNMTIRLTGNGRVQYVGGAVRGYPSYALYTYSVDANGVVQTNQVRIAPENKIDDLTKPLRRVP
ncbi:MAG: hypothetical protein WBD22_14935 [Pyrinomonadaceae bacterium]